MKLPEKYDKAFITTDELAEFLNISHSYACHMCKNEEVSAFKLGDKKGGKWRIPRDEFIKFVQRKFNLSEEKPQETETVSRETKVVPLSLLPETEPQKEVSLPPPNTYKGTSKKTYSMTTALPEELFKKIELDRVNTNMMMSRSQYLAEWLQKHYVH